MPFADVNGIRICYETQGSGDPILLVRGLGTQLIDWPDSFIQSLTSAGLEVIIFDNRDAGLSSKVPESYALLDMVDDLVGLLDHLEIRRAHLFGISLGGIIVQRTAIHYPERVKCLFSVMSTSGAQGLPLPDEEIVRRLFSTPQDLDSAIEAEIDFRKLTPSPAYLESDEQIREAVERSHRRSFDPEARARQAAAGRGDVGRDALLAKIEAPTLVIHGDADLLIPHQHGEDTARRIPEAEFLLLEGVAHAVPAGAAELYCNAVTDFIKRRWHR